MQIAYCGLRIADCGLAFNPKSKIRNPKSRSGVTLIELLIVMLIISILAALVIGVAAVAAETARQAQTRHVVERIHTLLTEYLDSYKTRRLKVRPAIESGITGRYTRVADRGRNVALARLYALRELMVMEIPDRWSDVLLNAVPSTPTGVADALYPYFEDNQGSSTTGRTQLANLYLRRYAQIADRNFVNAITGAANTREQIIENQGAECLYMVVSLACGDGEARTLFAEKDIGDTDGDGAPEFLDGWGHPISFLRWAPGFDSQIQINANELSSPLSASDVTRIAKDHDPFDVFRADSTAFRLVPLIYSGGRDESTGLFEAFDVPSWVGGKTVRITGTAPPYLSPALSQFQPLSDGTYTNFLGTSMHIVDS